MIVPSLGRWFRDDKKANRAEEMAQHVRALVLSEVLGLVSSTHRMVHNHMSL